MPYALPHSKLLSRALAGRGSGRRMSVQWRMHSTAHNKRETVCLLRRRERGEKAGYLLFNFLPTAYVSRFFYFFCTSAPRRSCPFFFLSCFFLCFCLLPLWGNHPKSKIYNANAYIHIYIKNHFVQYPKTQTPFSIIIN